MAKNTPARELDDVEWQDRPGHELLVDPGDLMPSQLLELISLVDDDLATEQNISSFLPAVQYIEKNLLTDEAAWRAFTREHGLAGMVELVAAYLGEAVGGER